MVGRDEEVHHASAWLTARSHHGGSKLPVTGGHSIVDRSCVESQLDDGQHVWRTARAGPSEVISTREIRSARAGALIANRFSRIMCSLRSTCSFQGLLNGCASQELPTDWSTKSPSSAQPESRASVEQIGDPVPWKLPFRLGGNHSRREPTGDGDGDPFPAFDSAHKSDAS